MRVRVLKLFGREVARWEDYEQATVSDVVAAMMAKRQEDENGESEVSRRFTDLTDRIMWDAADDDDDDFPLHDR